MIPMNIKINAIHFLIHLLSSGKLIGYSPLQRHFDNDGQYGHSSNTGSYHNPLSLAGAHYQLTDLLSIDCHNNSHDNKYPIDWHLYFLLFDSGIMYITFSLRFFFLADSTQQ